MSASALQQAPVQSPGEQETLRDRIRSEGRPRSDACSGQRKYRWVKTDWGLCIEWQQD